MNRRDAEVTPTPEPSPRPPAPRRRKRDRLRSVHRRVRHELVTARRWIVVLALAVVALGIFSAYLLAGPASHEEGGEETVSLGTGIASVGRTDGEPGEPAAGTPLPVTSRRGGEPGEGDVVEPPTEAPDLPQPMGQALTGGEASYYADKFTGRPTASGQRYDPVRFTAAHRTLPFGSKVRVTNPANGRQVVVRINDRGPFHPRRVIDLSRAAAAEIGLLHRGRGRVELELVE